MKASLSLVIAAVLWGVNFHLVKFMLGESSFIEAGTWRYVFGVIALAGLMVYNSRALSFKNIPLKGILLVGVIGLFVFNLLFFKGMQNTSALNAVLIVSLNPITTILLSALILGTPIKRYHLIGTLLSLFGVFVLLTKGELFKLSELHLNQGDILIFSANVVFALHHVWVKKYKGDFSNFSFTAYTNFICLVGFLLVAFLVPSSGLTLNHGPNYWLWATGVGVLGTAVAYSLWNHGLSIIGADRAGIFMNLVPLAAAITSLFLGLEVKGYHAVSGALIILGVSWIPLASNPALLVKRAA